MASKNRPDPIHRGVAQKCCTCKNYADRMWSESTREHYILVPGAPPTFQCFTLKSLAWYVKSHDVHITSCHAAEHRAKLVAHFTLERSMAAGLFRFWELNGSYYTCQDTLECYFLSVVNGSSWKVGDLWLTNAQLNSSTLSLPDTWRMWFHAPEPPAFLCETLKVGRGVGTRPGALCEWN